MLETLLVESMQDCNIYIVGLDNKCFLFYAISLVRSALQTQ